MAEMQPIRSKKKIKEVANYLKGWDEKYHIMFLIGIQTGLRVSDVLNLTVYDIRKMSAKKVREQKTKKRRFLYLNPKMEKEIEKYIQKNELDPDDYLIYSRKHDRNGNSKPISRVQAYRVLRTAGEAFGIDSMGTHTMRKTFGYHYYRQTHDIATLMMIFNHASQEETLRYIGIIDEEIMSSLDGFNLL